MRCLSVCLSVTFVDHVITNTYLQNFSPSGSHTILVYRYQTRWRYSDGNPTPLTGASNAGVVGKNEILDEYLASLHTGLQCCQLYEWQSVKTKLRRTAASVEHSLLRPLSVVRTRRRRSVCDGLDVTRRRRREVKPPLVITPIIFCCHRIS